MTRPTPLDRAWQAAYAMAGPVLRWSWRVWPRPHRGSLVAIMAGDRLLLLRSSYRAGWGFPGGGIDTGETPAAAAVRECREEIGLDVHIEGPPTIIEGRWEGRLDTVHLFTVALEAEPAIRLDHREIVEARFVPMPALSGLRFTGPVEAYLRSVGMVG